MIMIGKVICEIRYEISVGEILPLCKIFNLNFDKNW